MTGRDKDREDKRIQSHTPKGNTKIILNSGGPRKFSSGPLRLKLEGPYSISKGFKKVIGGHQTPPPDTHLDTLDWPLLSVLHFHLVLFKAIPSVTSHLNV